MAKQHKNRPKGLSCQVRVNVPNWDAHKDWCKKDGAKHCFLSTASKFNVWLAELIQKSG